MLKLPRIVPFLVITTLLAGCAASPTAFYANIATIDNVKLCRTLRSADGGSDATFAADVRRAVAGRGLSDASCDGLISRQNAAIGAAIVIGAAAFAVARNGGGGAVGVGTSTGAYDYDWDWDQFYNQHYQLVWACRGIQTGQFADTGKCAYKMQSDYRWPAK